MSTTSSVFLATSGTRFDGILTLAGTGHFASFHGTRGGGVGTTPLAVSPPIELELRGKKFACSSQRDEAINI